MTYSIYEDYTDHQLNLLVIHDCIPAKDLDEISIKDKLISGAVDYADGANWYTFDGVNNAGQLQPLIEKMIATGGFHMRSTNRGKFTRVIYSPAAFTDENWLRAIVICYLDHKDALQE